MEQILILGGGFAGLTAALYAARAGAEVAVLERALPGGQILFSERVENYPGRESTDGATLAAELTGQVTALGVRILPGDVTGVAPDGDGFRLDSGEERFNCRCLIVATGAVRRRLGVPGEDRLAGHGISWCATCDGAFFRGKPVAVIGGGNTAVSEAIHLSGICARVYLLYRGEALRADRALTERLEPAPGVIPMPGTRVEEFLGGQSLTGVRIGRNGQSETLAVDGVFEAIGTVPDTGLFASLLRRDRDGGILTDRACRTSVPGVFAVGDCRAGAFRQLVGAAADGAVAGMLAAEAVRE